MSCRARICSISARDRMRPHERDQKNITMTGYEMPWEIDTLDLHRRTGPNHLINQRQRDRNSHTRFEDVGQVGVLLAVVLHGVAAKLEFPTEKTGKKTDALGIIPNTSHTLKKLTSPVVDLIPKRKNANTRVNDLRESPNSLLYIKTIPGQKA